MRNSKRRMLAIALILTAPMLMQCANVTPTITPNSSCVAFGPITPTAHDWQIMSWHLNTQITDYDAAWDSLCAKNPIE